MAQKVTLFSLIEVGMFCLFGYAILYIFLYLVPQVIEKQFIPIFK